MGYDVGYRVGTTLGERGALVGAAESVGVGSEMQGIEVRERALMGV